MKHCNLRPEKITVHPLSEKKKKKNPQQWIESSRTFFEFNSYSTLNYSMLNIYANVCPLALTENTTENVSSGLAPLVLPQEYIWLSYQHGA